MLAIAPARGIDIIPIPWGPPRFTSDPDSEPRPAAPPDRPPPVGPRPRDLRKQQRGRQSQASSKALQEIASSQHDLASPLKPNTLYRRPGRVNRSTLRASAYLRSLGRGDESGNVGGRPKHSARSRRRLRLTDRPRFRVPLHPARSVYRGLPRHRIWVTSPLRFRILLRARQGNRRPARQQPAPADQGCGPICRRTLPPCRGCRLSTVPVIFRNGRALARPAAPSPWWASRRRRGRPEKGDNRPDKEGAARRRRLEGHPTPARA